MAAAERTSLIVLGAGGDLTERLLVPALGEVLTEQPDLDVALIGAARSERHNWTDYVRDALRNVDIDLAAPAVTRMLASTWYEATDATEAEELAELFSRADGRVIVYFALAQTITEKVLDALAGVTLPDDVRVALEKPIGIDEESARRINRKADDLVGPNQVLRVDHFLGMAATRNLLGVRSQNPAIEAALQHATAIEVIFNETLALEGRAEFYEDTGAIRDMLQSHLLQVMGVAMAPIPEDLGRLAHDVADLLSHTRLAAPPAESLVAGRYTAGDIDGTHVPGYLEEDGIDPDGRVETYARLRLIVNTPRWKHVAVTLESGKAIGQARQEVVIRFATPGDAESVLTLGFEDGSVSWQLTTLPGDDPLTLSAQQACRLSAYGWVIRGLLVDDFTFTVASAAAEQGWRIVQPALDAIADGTVPIQDYAAGATNPLR